MNTGRSLTPAEDRHQDNIESGDSSALLLVLSLLGVAGDGLGVTSTDVALADTVEVAEVLLVHAAVVLVDRACRLLDSVAVDLETLIVVGVDLALCHVGLMKNKQ